MFGPMGTIRGWIGLKDDSLKMLNKKMRIKIYTKILYGVTANYCDFFFFDRMLWLSKLVWYWRFLFSGAQKKYNTFNIFFYLILLAHVYSLQKNRRLSSVWQMGPLPTVQKKITIIRIIQYYCKPRQAIDWSHQLMFLSQWLSWRYGKCNRRSKAIFKICTTSS